MIEISALGVSLGDKEVLRDLNLTVAAGDVLAILGANGIGKTTLLNCLVGLTKPSAGSFAVHGRIGYVPQLFQSAFSFSVLDIVLMGRARHLGLFGAPRARDYEIADDCLRQMKVADLRDRSFNHLSGGQRQLVMIAQALASECDVLILDEPCSALDYKNQGIVIDTLRALNERLRLTILFTTHAPQHGLEAASHALLMQGRGRHVHGPVADVLTAEHLSQLYGIPIARAEFAGRDKFTFAPTFDKADSYGVTS